MKINSKLNRKQKFKIIILGIITGFLSGLFASGGGMIAVPGLVYFVHSGEKEARAIAIFCICFSFFKIIFSTFSENQL